MKTRKQILAIIESLSGCQITSSRIQEQLLKPIGKSTINWHIQRLVQDGLVETVQRTSSPTGSVIKIKDSGSGICDKQVHEHNQG